MSIWDELRSQWRVGGVLMRLVLLNAAVFLVLFLIGLLCWISNNPPLDDRIVLWLAGHSDGATMLHRPWTALTYMFTHLEPMHLLWNMIMLWFGGNLFLNILGPKRLLGNYILGGLAGFAAYFLAANYLPAHLSFSGGSVIIGASASVMAIVIGIATFRPETQVGMLFVGVIALKYVALIMLLLDLIALRLGSNSGGHIAHLGGALYGYLAATQLKKGRDWSLGFIAFLERIGSMLTSKRKGRMRVEKGRRERVHVRDEAWHHSRKARQERIDAILDKISRSGYDSLSKEEKEILFNASKEK